MASVVLRALAGAFTLTGVAFFAPVAMAQQSLEGVLAHAYRNNPDLSAARAGVKIANESVPAALSGYRPSLSASALAGYSETQSRVGGNTFTSTLYPRQVTLTASQTLYDGNRTANSVRAADQGVMVSREDLRNREQIVLLATATAYMNVLRDQAVLDLQRRNVDVLEEQLRATRNRFDVGEVTRTDVAQSQSRLQLAMASVAQAQADLATSRAVFRQQSGLDAGRLRPARSMERALPSSLQAAVNAGLSDHPQIRAAMHGADAALIQVHIAEGALYPVLSADASISRGLDTVATARDLVSGAVNVRLTVPIFANGGRDYATIRQAKEAAGQRRIQIDIARESVRQAVVASWGNLEGARAMIRAAEAQVKAAEVALNGIREEAKVGQRTTLDVLNAQQELTNARVTLVRSQRDKVVLSYSVLSAMGRLAANRIGLKVETYDPTVHYDQTRDRWFGLRTPDGN